MQSQVCAFHGRNVACVVCSQEWWEKDGASCVPVVEVAGPADTVAQLSMQPWSSRYIEGTFAKDFYLLTQLRREQRAKMEDSFASLRPLHLCCLYFGSGYCLNCRGLLITQGGSFYLSDPLPGG